MRLVSRVAAATAFAFFVIVFVWLLLPASAPGPDFGNYNGWARAFLSGNVFTRPGRWGYVSDVDLAEIRESYREYLQVSGFLAKKAALLGFLRSKGIDG